MQTNKKCTLKKYLFMICVCSALATGQELQAHFFSGVTSRVTSCVTSLVSGVVHAPSYAWRAVTGCAGWVVKRCVVDPISRCVQEEIKKSMVHGLNADDATRPICEIMQTLLGQNPDRARTTRLTELAAKRLEKPGTRQRDWRAEYDSVRGQFDSVVPVDSPAPEQQSQVNQQTTEEPVVIAVTSVDHKTDVHTSSQTRGSGDDAQTKALVRQAVVRAVQSGLVSQNLADQTVRALAENGILPKELGTLEQKDVQQPQQATPPVVPTVQVSNESARTQTATTATTTTTSCVTPKPVVDERDEAQWNQLIEKLAEAKLGRGLQELEFRTTVTMSDKTAPSNESKAARNKRRLEAIAEQLKHSYEMNSKVCSWAMFDKMEKVLRSVFGDFMMPYGGHVGNGADAGSISRVLATKFATCASRQIEQAVKQCKKYFQDHWLWSVERTNLGQAEIIGLLQDPKVIEAIAPLCGDQRCLEFGQKVGALGALKVITDEFCRIFSAPRILDELSLVSDFVRFRDMGRLFLLCDSKLCEPEQFVGPALRYLLPAARAKNIEYFLQDDPESATVSTQQKDETTARLEEIGKALLSDSGSNAPQKKDMATQTEEVNATTGGTATVKKQSWSLFSSSGTSSSSKKDESGILKTLARLPDVLNEAAEKNLETLTKARPQRTEEEKTGAISCGEFMFVSSEPNYTGNPPREMMELITILCDPARRAERPNGMLLYGPKGGGKTTMAQLLSYFTKFTLFYCKGSEFKTLWIGSAPTNVKHNFERARRFAQSIPSKLSLAQRRFLQEQREKSRLRFAHCIQEQLNLGAPKKAMVATTSEEQDYSDSLVLLFIDEFDALIGGARTEYGFGSTGSDHGQAIAALLKELEECAKHNIFFIAATNMSPESFDPALMRKGRMDYKVKVDLPDEAQRVKVLSYYAQRNAFAECAKRRLLTFAHDAETKDENAATLVSIVSAARRYAGLNRDAYVTGKYVDRAIEDYKSERKATGTYHYR